MMTMQISAVCPLESGECAKYEGLAFDGNYFYLTLPQSLEVHCFDSCFCLKKRIATCRGYFSICYDKGSNCFWALAQRGSNRIYKLDACLNEIDILYVRANDGGSFVLTGVSCFDRARLLVSSASGILLVTKSSGNDPAVIKKTSGDIRYTAIENMPKGYMCAYIRPQCKALMCCDDDGESQVQCCLPDEYSVEDLCTAGNGLDFCLSTMYVLASKHCRYSYLFKCSIMEVLPDGCDCGGFPPFPPCPDPDDGCSGAEGIIKSIAKIEASLSHILNAEGEKIQKAIASAKDVKELMEVNESVTKTITHITHLEQVLFAKLEVAKKLCDKEHHCTEHCCIEQSNCPLK